MGIDNVSIKTFDSTGSQSVCRANEYTSRENISSSLLSNCKKMYISGTGETIIPGNLKTFPISSNYDIFSINAESSALSEISFCVEFRFKAPSSPVDFEVFVSNDIILRKYKRHHIRPDAAAGGAAIRPACCRVIPENLQVLERSPNFWGERSEPPRNWTNIPRTSQVPRTHPQKSIQRAPPGNPQNSAHK